MADKTVWVEAGREARLSTPMEGSLPALTHKYTGQGPMVPSTCDKDQVVDTVNYLSSVIKCCYALQPCSGPPSLTLSSSASMLKLISAIRSNGALQEQGPSVPPLLQQAWALR